MSNANELAVFAARQNLSPEVAVVFPALFEKSAAETGMSVRALISAATYDNAELGEYLASVAKKVAEQFHNSNMFA